ncbi:MAG: DUF3493 domain-containing protein [Cyanobacteriota bacterium]|nr:DUF3493 domain-containing protein [Cyanobacteriota bacterium]
MPNSPPQSSGDPKLSSQDRVRLMSELASPYRGLRKFIYLAVGASGALGGAVFLMRVLAGRELDVSLPSLALQLGVVAGAVALTRLENRMEKRLQERVSNRLKVQSSQVNEPTT